jgi:DNA-directed RNA polymerase specialized sigma24 family protein
MKEEIKVNRTSLKKLREAFQKHGGKSPEFLEAVRGLIIYVIRRYCGFYSEDLFQTSYLRVLEALGYYNPARSNIATFVFAVTRNRVSQFLYNNGKRLRESADSLPFLESESNVIVELEADMDCESALKKKLKRIRIIGDERRVAKFCRNVGEESFHFRFIVWISMGEVE